MVDTPNPTTTPAPAPKPAPAPAPAPVTAPVPPPAAAVGTTNPPLNPPAQKAAAQVEPGPGNVPVQVQPAPPEGTPAGSDVVDTTGKTPEELFAELKAKRQRGDRVTFVQEFDPNNDPNFPYHPANEMGEGRPVSPKTQAEQEAGRKKLEHHAKRAQAEHAKGAQNVSDQGVVYTQPSEPKAS